MVEAQPLSGITQLAVGIHAPHEAGFAEKQTESPFLLPHALGVSRAQSGPGLPQLFKPQPLPTLHVPGHPLLASAALQAFSSPDAKL